MNTVVLMGRLTKDPMFVKGEKSDRISFTLATPRGFKKDDGVDFIPVTYFGKAGNGLSKLSSYLFKGKQVLVRGSVSVTSKDKRTYTNVLGDKIELLGPGKKEDAVKQEEVPVDTDINF